jgi:hypothetical protein
VTHAKSSRQATYGELVDSASKLPLPDQEKVPLKNESEFELIGQATPRVDIPSKVNGSAQFGIDVRVPDMLFAVVARCPTFGGKPAHFDASKAKVVPGVKDVFEIPALGKDMYTAGGIVVVADSTWAAMKGRQALQIGWDHGAAASESSASLHESLRAAASKPAKRIRNDGNVDAALSSGAKRVEALRIPLSRPCHDGTDEHHRACAGERRGGLGSDAISRLGAAYGSATSGCAACKGHRAHDLDGRRLRTSLHGGLSGRGGTDRQGCPQARAVGVEPRG